ncbi:YihY/virulence factor BrkB family protein [halophilic archaeon]|nr:YihY/virulence factor BrkB family protein [halophilic archaeon]
MSQTIGDAVTTVRRIVRLANGSYVPFLAGSFAYHSFLLLLPLLLFVLVALSALIGDANVAYLVDFTRPYLTERARTLLAETLRGQSDRVDVAIVGAGAVVWSLFRIFRGLDLAFSTIYDTSTHESVWGQVRDGSIAAIAVSLALLAAVVAATVIAMFPWDPLVRVLNVGLFVVVLVVVFFPLYYVFPNVEVSVREVLPGTVGAAVGWVVFHVLFQVYSSYAVTLEAYGVLGIVISVLVWLYSSMLILLFGVATNAVLADRA